METELISSQLSIAYGASAILEWLKRKSWCGFMNVDTPALNRATSMVVAFFTAIAIHMATEWEAQEGVLVLTITGLTAGNIAHGVLAWIQQFALQQGAFKLLIKES